LFSEVCKLRERNTGKKAGFVEAVMEERRGGVKTCRWREGSRVR
jgi:hypothetical protein